MELRIAIIGFTIFLTQVKGPRLRSEIEISALTHSGFSKRTFVGFVDPAYNSPRRCACNANQGGDARRPPPDRVASSAGDGSVGWLMAECQALTCGANATRTIRLGTIIECEAVKGGEARGVPQPEPQCIMSLPLQRWVVSAAPGCGARRWRAAAGCWTGRLSP